MDFRPMTEAEVKYSYTQSCEIAAKTGFIGHLRGDLEDDRLYSMWNPWDKSGDIQPFKADLEECIQRLRLDPETGKPLQDRKRLAKYCRSESVRSFGNFLDYGIRADSDQYAFLLRLNPNKGYNTVYCYAYTRHWLDLHLSRAERGIRFITSTFRERFRLTDGDQVRLTIAGEQKDRVCRYVDDYHVELDGSLFHICELAEKLEYTDGTVIPLRSSLPKQCYSELRTTGELVLLRRGEIGYVKPGVKAGDVSPSQLNAAMGVTKAQEAAMSAGSMFGWDTPAADPKNYDENGKAIHPRH